MANELRGSMDANEFKDYILSFMFYRFLSEAGGVVEQLYYPTEKSKRQRAYRRVASGEDKEEFEGYFRQSQAIRRRIPGYAGGRLRIAEWCQAIIRPCSTISIKMPDQPGGGGFHGLFNDLNHKFRLGALRPAKALNNVVKLVDEVEYQGRKAKIFWAYL